MSEMKNTRLVQRLHKPRSFQAFGMKDNPFSFGGGLKNGGLSDEGMDLIRDIFAFDYMGAAEYEFGAVPEALSWIVKADLTTALISVPLKEVEKPFGDKHTEEPEGNAIIYVLAPSEHLTLIVGRIESWARKEPAYPNDFKERSHLSYTLRPPDDEERRRDTCGWLELNNGFFFFTDKEMFEQTCRLFGVEVPEIWNGGGVSAFPTEAELQARPVPNIGDSVWVWFCNNCGAAEGATMQAGCCRHCGISDNGTRLLLRVEVEAKTIPYSWKGELMFATTDTHLGTWTREEGATFRLMLFDTGEVGEYGKHRLRYVLSIFPEERRPVHFEASDYFPSPMLDLSSDECAGALLSFFGYYGDSIAHGSEDVPEFTREQRWSLERYHDALTLWSHDLDPQP